MDAPVTNPDEECFGVYLDKSGSQPICMHLKGCGAGFYLAPLMKSSLHNPSSQQSLWVKLPGTKDDQLQLPFADEYNFHPMSSYALSCKYQISNPVFFDMVINLHSSNFKLKLIVKFPLLENRINDIFLVMMKLLALLLMRIIIVQ